MCGIVGYLGERNPKDVILSGLKKLEYRGYDSAGVAILHDGKTKRVRSMGKLKVLEEKLIKEPFNGHTGIGHTRWATHGAPSEINAHPHQVDGVSIVHNGIIENFQDIRRDLLTAGRNLESQTDSELIAHLIALQLKSTGHLQKAVEKVVGQLRGAYAVLVTWEQSPDEIVAFKEGPPLVLGQGQGENFVASDVQALIAYTKNFIYLEDHEVAIIKRDSLQVFSRDGKPVTKALSELNWDAEMVEKQGFPYFMLKEIFEQPRTLAATLEMLTDKQNQKIVIPPTYAEQLKAVFAEATDLRIVACGTSFYAGSYGKYIFERFARLATEVDISSEFRYRDPVLNKKSVVVVISQSGETADTLAALRLVKQGGREVISICNVKNSTIARESSLSIPMNCGPEIGVASTKAFTATLLNLLILAGQVAKVRGALNPDEEGELVQALMSLPAQVDTVLTHDKYFETAARGFHQYRGFLFMGRGVSYPIALEGALKLKELAYLHAEGYAAGEMKHGPLALIDERIAVVMIAPSDDLYEKTVSNLEEARARGAKVIAVGTGENTRLREVSDAYLAIPMAHWALNPILATIPIQLLAYHMANSFGYDVDQPRNLAKSVTVE